MKKFILTAVSLSALCAGPVITPLVDYDKEDAIEAETKVEQKLILPVAKQPVVTAPGVRKEVFPYEIGILAGRNFADSSSLVKDATTLGVRLNKYITEDIAIQIGYDRIFDADYKFKKATRGFKTEHTANLQTPETANCPSTETPGDTTETNNGNSGTGDTTIEDTGTGNGDTDNVDNNSDSSGTGDTGTTDADSGNSGTNGNENGDNSSNGNDGNSGNNSSSNDNGGDNGNNGNGDGNGNITPKNPISQLGASGARETDIDRFYINALKEIHSTDTNFIPYLFAGLGYEHVNDKNLGIESQGFFNTGGGLKYSLNEKFRLISEAKVIKKFKDKDLDVVAMLGVGLLFGDEGESTVNQTNTNIPVAEPKPDNQDLTIILDAHEDSVPATIAPDLPVVAEPIERVKLDLHELKHSGDYYIQVAALSSNTAVEKLLTKLESKNLRTVVKTAQVHGREIQRILVGPYMSRSEAKAELPEVKEVAKGAFIKKLP